MEFEVWKDVVGWEGRYKISSFGRLLCLKNGLIRKPILDKYGYNFVTLRLKGKNKTQFVHRLVAAAFIPNPSNKPQVNHKNRIRTDNSIENLEWVTNKENIIHSFQNGRVAKPSQVGSQMYCAKLVDSDVLEIKHKRLNGIPVSVIAKYYSVCTSTIYSILSGKKWKHVS